MRDNTGRKSGMRSPLIDGARAALSVQPRGGNRLVDLARHRLDESHQRDHPGENDSGENTEHEKKTKKTGQHDPPQAVLWAEGSVIGKRGRAQFHGYAGRRRGASNAHAGKRLALVALDCDVNHQ